MFNFTNMSKYYSTIFDRWSAISEPIYGRVLRGAQYTVEQKEQLHRWTAREGNPLVIYCRPRDETILNFKEPQMVGVIDRAKLLIEAYDEEMKLVAKNLVTCDYDYEQHDYANLREIIINHLQGAIH